MPKPQRRTNTPIRSLRVPKNFTFSYKDYQTVGKYVTEQGYIIGRVRTGLSQKQQRQLTRAVKRARQLALLPFTQTV